MSEAKTLEFRFERTIPAPLDEVFDGWLDPKVPGNPWNVAEKYSLDARTDGLFYWHFKGTSHYGRFTKVERPKCIQKTWVSPHTLGWESVVTVTFKPQGEETLMTLVHSGLPDNEGGRRHEKGWEHFLDMFQEQLGRKERA